MCVTQVDLDRPLEEQGPFDLIIQKLMGYMAAAIEGSKDAMKTLKQVEVSKLTDSVVIAVIELDLQSWPKSIFEM